MRNTNPLILILVLFGALGLTSCAKKAYYNIDTRTDIQSEGNYVIRWQVNPGMDGNVAIYASTDANSYPSKPFVVESIGKQITTYQSDGSVLAQQYFLLVFADREMRVVAHREVPTIGITNARDFGGYMTTDGEQVKWGMLFRSGDLSHLLPQDSLVLSSIGKPHQIVLSDEVSDPVPDKPFSAFEPVILMADKSTNIKQLKQSIHNETIDAPGVESMYSTFFKSYAFDNINQFSTALHYLLDPSHYPIVISDTWGKDRAAFLVMLIQSALNVSRADIINDYVLSNQLLIAEKLEPRGFAYPQMVQEAITEFYRSRPNDMHAIMYDIERQYGSVSQYMDKVLHFSVEEQKKLRELLLY